jgi:hypothetical protein
MTGKRLFAVLAAVTGALLIGGVAYATIPDSAGVFHGCYVKKTGALRLIDPTSEMHCASSEVGVQWSQTGPTGATGTEGATGPSGTPSGPAGGIRGGSYPNPGFAGAVLYESSPVYLAGGAADRDAAAVAYCPTGQVAIAGGGNGGADFVSFYNSEPTTDGANVGTPGDVANGWRVDGDNPTSTPTSIVAYVLCVPDS